ALEVERRNLLHPLDRPEPSYVQKLLAREEGVFVAASDYLRSLPEMIARCVPGGLFPLGTDGFGRSETRAALRRFFEVDAECITVAVLSALCEQGKIAAEIVKGAMEEFGIRGDYQDPWRQ